MAASAVAVAAIVGQRPTHYSVHQATLKDRPAFARLWAAFLQEEFDHGSPLKGTQENLLEFVRLFETYVVGSLFGFTLLATNDDSGEAVGVLLGGERPPGGLRLDTIYGRTITLWGVYVDPGHRRSGVAWQLQGAGLDKGRALGFKTCLSAVLLGYTAGEANAFGWGALARETLIAVPLGKEHIYGQRPSEQV